MSDEVHTHWCYKCQCYWTESKPPKECAHQYNKTCWPCHQDQLKPVSTDPPSQMIDVNPSKHLLTP